MHYERCEEDLKRVKGEARRIVDFYIEFRELGNGEKEKVKEILTKIGMIGEFYSELFEVENIIRNIFKLKNYNSNILLHNLKLLLKGLKELGIEYEKKLELPVELEGKLTSMEVEVFKFIIETLEEHLQGRILNNRFYRRTISERLETTERFIWEYKGHLAEIIAELISRLLNILEKRYGNLSDTEKAIILDKLGKLSLPSISSTLNLFYHEIHEKLGIKPISKRRLELSKTIKEKVLKRDNNYQCVICSSKENLEIHHRIPYSRFLLPRNANRLDNLITLCKKCHRNKHREELEALAKASLEILKKTREKDQKK